MSERTVHFIVRLESGEKIAEYTGTEENIPGVGKIITFAGSEDLGSFVVESLSVEHLVDEYDMATLVVKPATN